VAQDESEGQRILDEIGARYVIMDSDFVLWKIDAAMSVTGKSAQLHDSFVQEYQGEYYLRTYFFPEYYRSMSVRLYCFGGKAVTPAAGDCQVISWTLQGQYKVLTGTPQPFDTYEAALAWIDSQGSGNYQIVGSSPLISPVPLEELEGFSLCHDSESKAPVSKTETMPQVRIFEYVGQS
jgi:hypothetical protein